MSLTRTLLLAAAAATLSSAAFAQAPAAPAAAPADAAPADAAAPAPAPGVPQVAVITSNASGNIIANLEAAGKFTILLKALTATNLQGLLGTAGREFTLFAPTDEAFAALPAGTLDNWMKPENAAAFQRAVAYHVVATKITADKVKGAKGPIPSAIATPLQVDGSGESIKVNDANVIQADVATANGSIYVVDKVLQAPSA